VPAVDGDGRVLHLSHDGSLDRRKGLGHQVHDAGAGTILDPQLAEGGSGPQHFCAEAVRPERREGKGDQVAELSSLPPEQVEIAGLTMGEVEAHERSAAGQRPGRLESGQDPEYPSL
jgi:hypothetical protein